MWHKIAPPRFDCRDGAFSSSAKPVYYNRYDFKNVRMEPIWRHSRLCRESERLHGIICCYIGFALFSPCKFQTGNPSRRCALQGSLWAGLAACCHAFLARSPDAPDHGAASPKAVRQRTLFSCHERKYISSQLQWIASKCGNGTGKIRKYFRQDRESRRYWLNSVGDY